MRVRITFAKRPEMRFIGHLDLHRAWERTFRRAKLPLAYTQGFKPHPRLVLASALPLGCTSQHEELDAWLEEQLTPDEISTALNRATPPGIQILDVNEQDPRSASLPSLLESSIYQITFVSPLIDLEERIEAICRTTSLPRTWREKTYDLRPLILDIRLVTNDEKDCQRISVTLAARENATGRPDEVVRSLGGQPEKAHIHRTGLTYRINSADSLPHSHL